MQNQDSIVTRYQGLFCGILLLVFFCLGGIAEAAQSYTVKSGDTLWALANKWGIQVKDVKNANALHNDALRIGQKLVIPGKSHLSKTKSAKGSKVVSRGGYRDVVSLAQSFLGVRYVSASSNPRIGFDCSGLTQYVYSLAGIRLPRSSHEQFNVGVPVSRSQLVPGDLVFFNTGGGISHVGIYSGGNSFISATNSRGVAIAGLSSSYWGPRYVGARRVVSY